MVSSLRRNLQRHKAEEIDAGFDWPAWQAEQLREIGRYRRENRSIMREYAPTIDAKTAELLMEQYEEGAADTGAEIAGLKGSSDGFFAVDDHRIDSLVKEVNGKFYNAETSSLRLMDDVYRRTVSKTAIAASTGALTTYQAVDMATKDFLAAGITSVEYKDGRRVNVASYAEMALRTAALRSYLRGAAQRREAAGIDTVLVSQYGACSEICLPWQGRVYIDDVFGAWHGEQMGQFGRSRDGKWYMLLSAAIDGGLFHPNCRHTLTTYIDGVSALPPRMDETQIRRNAALEAEQRAKEREVQKWKRMEEGALDPRDREQYAQQRLEAQRKLRTFVREHDDVLRRDYWREQTHGLQSTSERGIINKGDAPVGVDIEIDELTPCLVESESGQVVPTTYRRYERADLRQLHAAGWLFDWEDIGDAEVYGITAAGDGTLQGLIAVEDYARDRALYIKLVESAPQNKGMSKRYRGVGGHLFAVAALESKKRGYGGFLFLDAKNRDLVQYYHETFGAQWIGGVHGYRMVLDEDAAQALLDKYTFEEG